jgi:hypothetical protein
MNSPRAFRAATHFSLVFSGLRASVILLAMTAGASAPAQEPSGFETQISAAHAALSAGDLDRALTFGDAAIRIGPERWDGYAVAGQALCELRRYEPAADALSKAIERAPEAQQATLRDLRRQCLVAESAKAGASLPDRTVAPSARDASQPDASPPRAELAPASPRENAQSVGTGGVRSDPSLWLDPATGLMWARPWYYPQNGTPMPWNLGEAQAFCTMLNLGGYSNWRLPSVDELQHVFHASGKAWRWSNPTFDPGYGIDEALRLKQWRPAELVIDGDHFEGNRLFLWTSTPADRAGEHVGLYFGKRYNVSDDQRMGTTFEGATFRTPFQGYALCVRIAH